MDTGMITSMARRRKITIEIDEQLLRRAQKQSGEGITGTIRQGLQILAAADAYKKLARMRGKVKFSVDLQTLREDRR